MKKIIKNVVWVVIVFIAIITLAGCTKENTEYKAYVIHNGSYDIGKDTKKIIANKQELEDFCDELESDLDIKDKYDEKFFENKSLAIMSVELGNSAESITIKKVSKDGNNVKIVYEIDSPKDKVGLTVMMKDFIVVEVDKDIKGIEEHNSSFVPEKVIY